ncbi:zinc transporter ZIP3 [Anopheles aquasalis]|uniref:zinc transporter ZIP3 n=1 Tax=Anopheles aquasalis TaxID=42839 RepID=UPI00215A9BAF|nr:zinc transporter ZIP3 [Anopheles aquasalis]XP_050084508.1 zinc transporter ZIP3 [Anopheles aquasalis]
MELATVMPDPTMDPAGITRNEAKLLAIVALGAGSFICGVLPLCCSQRNRERYPRLLSFLLCFGAGVLLATAIVHMLPEIRSALQQYAEIVFCGGFFLMYTIDELMVLCGVGEHNHEGESSAEQSTAVVRRRNSLDTESDAASTISGGRGYGSNAETESLLKFQQRSISETKLPVASEPHPGPSNSNRCAAPRGSVQPSNEVHLTGVFGLLLALSLHSLLEGLAIGVQNSPTKVLLLLGAVSAHKFVVGFALGVELCTHGSRHRCSHVLQVLTFSLGSVAGIGMGMGLDGLNEALTNVVMPVLQGLAGGTLLYVTVSEVLPRERRKRTRISAGVGPLQLVAVLLGFSLMSALSLLLTDE